jgi:DNA gyrase/topoisomerase IV subunit B
MGLAPLRSTEVGPLDSGGARLREVYDRPAPLPHATRTTRSSDRSPLSWWSWRPLRHRLTRYKGSGEINPGRLWETTLDPEVRSLLQGTTTHADAAEEAFPRP